MMLKPHSPHGIRMGQIANGYTSIASLRPVYRQDA